MLSGNLMKSLTGLLVSLIALSGCSGDNQATTARVEQIAASATESASTWGELDSCNAFQEVVWTLDNSPDEARVAIQEQQAYLLDSSGAHEDIVRETLNYYNLLLGLIGSSEGESSLLELMVQRPQEVDFQNLKETHEDFAVLCDSVGFTIFHDTFLISSHAPMEEERPTPSPAQTSAGKSNDKCFESMRKASLELSSSVAERYLKETAEYCGGKAEWYEALRTYPYAMGFPDVIGNELDILCFKYGSSPACRNP